MSPSKSPLDFSDWLNFSSPLKQETSPNKGTTHPYHTESSITSSTNEDHAHLLLQSPKHLTSGLEPPVLPFWNPPPSFLTPRHSYSSSDFFDLDDAHQNASPASLYARVPRSSFSPPSDALYPYTPSRTPSGILFGTLYDPITDMCDVSPLARHSQTASTPVTTLSEEDFAIRTSSKISCERSTAVMGLEREEIEDSSNNCEHSLTTTTPFIEKLLSLIAHPANTSRNFSSPILSTDPLESPFTSRRRRHEVHSDSLSPARPFVLQTSDHSSFTPSNRFPQHDSVSSPLTPVTTPSPLVCIDPFNGPINELHKYDTRLKLRVEVSAINKQSRHDSVARLRQLQGRRFKLGGQPEQKDAKFIKGPLIRSEPDSPTPLPRAKRSRLRNERDEDDQALQRSPVTSPIPSISSTKRKPSDPGIRTFPSNVPINPSFALFYRRFALCSYPACEATDRQPPPHPGGLDNKPRDAFDLYTPRFVKGRGRDKVGLCPICFERSERSGEGKKEWLSMKFSAFNYHMQYAHGISPVTALPFSPPIAFRTVTRPSPAKKERSQIEEGKCHKCKKWVSVEGIKDVEHKIKELFWWKHAATCHKGSTIEGERDVFIEDDFFQDALKQCTVHTS